MCNQAEVALLTPYGPIVLVTYHKSFSTWLTMLRRGHGYYSYD